MGSYRLCRYSKHIVWIVNFESGAFLYIWCVWVGDGDGVGD